MRLFKHFCALCLATLLLAASPTIKGKIIGTIKINNDSVFVPDSVLNIYCINGIKYIGRLESSHSSSLTPFYSRSGEPESCK